MNPKEQEILEILKEFKDDGYDEVSVADLLLVLAERYDFDPGITENDTKKMLSLTELGESILEEL